MPYEQYRFVGYIGERYALGANLDSSAEETGILKSSVRPVIRCHRDNEGTLVVRLDAAVGPQVIIVIGAAAPKSESSD